MRTVIIQRIGIQVDLMIQPPHPALGYATLELYHGDARGIPLEDAILGAKGGMTHTAFLACRVWMAHYGFHFAIGGIGYPGHHVYSTPTQCWMFFIRGI